MRKTTRAASALAATALAFSLAACGSDDAGEPAADPTPDVTAEAPTPEPEPEPEETEPVEQPPADGEAMYLVEGRVFIGDEFTEIPALLVGDEIWPTHVPLVATADFLGHEAIFDGEQGWTVTPAGEFMFADGDDGVVIYDGDLFIDIETVRTVFATSAFVSAGEIHIGSDMN